MLSEGREYMPKLSNIIDNIVLNLNLVKNESIDVKLGRADFENWIPFEFDFCIEERETYVYPEEQGAMFSLEDIKRMLLGFESIIKEKSEKREVKRFSWGPTENYFSIDLYETYEDNDINVELWIVVGELTQGKSYGYNRGFRFEVSLDELKCFTKDLRDQLSYCIDSK